MKKLIIESNETIACPHCAEEFALKESITQQTIERYENAYSQVIESERRQIKQTLAVEAKQEAAEKYLEDIAELNSQLKTSALNQQALTRRLEEQQIQIRNEVTKEIQNKNTSKLQLLENDLKEKDKLIQDFTEKEIVLRNEKNQLEQQKREFELQIQRRVDEEKHQLQSKLSEDFKLKEAELQKKINDAQLANEALSRKLEQGSQQLQGEVLELEVEEILLATFRDDEITPVGKGQKGGDVIQHVTTRLGNKCGSIIWETKRAQKWSKDWVEKVKRDQQDSNASIAVIVSTIFPTVTKEPFILYEGVWIVRPSAAKSLAFALRTGLISTAKQKAVAAGKDENMGRMYDYLCSPQFTGRVIAIWEAQNKMLEQIVAERNAFTRQWKLREKQIDQISNNILEMCGDLQGITGSPLPQLESIGQFLPESVD